MRLSYSFSSYVYLTWESSCRTFVVVSGEGGGASFLVGLESAPLEVVSRFRRLLVGLL